MKSQNCNEGYNLEILCIRYQKYPLSSTNLFAIFPSQHIHTDF